MADRPPGGTWSPHHAPVLLARCLALLGPALVGRSAVLVDATVGLGGHAAAFLEAHPGLTLVGLDRDPQALDLARGRLAAYAKRIHLVHAVYDELPDVLERLDVKRPSDHRHVMSRSP